MNSTVIRIQDVLSKRERQLLELAVTGMSDKQIAATLGINPGTVGTYWGRVRGKLGPLGRTELVARYLREESERIIDSLKHENSQLLRDVQIHSETKHEINTRLTLMSDVIFAAPDAILVVNPQGIVELANAQAGVMFRCDANDLRSRSLVNLMPERYREIHASHQNEYMDRPIRKLMGEHLATVALRADGEEFLIAATLNTTGTAENALIICIIRDMTEDAAKRSLTKSDAELRKASSAAISTAR